MAFRALCVAVLLSSVPIAGCGTVSNVFTTPPPQGGKTPFGGVKQDVWAIKKAANGDTGFATPAAAAQGNGQHPQVAHVLLYAADLPFSAVGDVLTWPYTTAYSIVNQPIPVPPIVQAPDSPPIQPVADASTMPRTSPDTLPEPRKLP